MSVDALTSCMMDECIIPLTHHCSLLYQCNTIHPHSLLIVDQPQVTLFIQCLPYNDNHHYSNDYPPPDSDHHHPITPTLSRPPSYKSSYTQLTLSVCRNGCMCGVTHMFWLCRMSPSFTNGYRWLLLAIVAWT